MVNNFSLANQAKGSLAPCHAANISGRGCLFSEFFSNLLLKFEKAINDLVRRPRLADLPVFHIANSRLRTANFQADLHLS